MQGKLKQNALGLIGAITLGVVMLSPAMTLYGGFGPTFLAAGSAAPLAFIWAFIAIVPTALSYAYLSSEIPESGSAAAWITRAYPGRLSRWACYMVFLYYLTNFIIQPVTLGVFLGDLFAFFGLAHGIYTYFLGVLICLVVSAWIVYRGIQPSIHGALLFLLIEATIVAALCITVLFVNHSQISFSGFVPGNSNSHGIFQAMVFSVLAYCGFDVVSTLAEETKFSRKLIPKATIISLVIYAVFIILGIWALCFGAQTEELKKVASEGRMPIQMVAQNFWGSWSVLVTFTAISASLGLAVATSVGASRILFWMSQKSLIPSKFSKLHSVYEVPWNSLHTIFAVGLVAAIAAGTLLGPYNAYLWWCSTSTFFALTTFLFVNFSSLILNWNRNFESVKTFFSYFTLPSVGILINAYLLYRCFFKELWSGDFATGKSIVLFDVSVAAIFLVLAFLKSRKTLEVQLSS